jgi:hypothetical protein
MIIMNDMHEQTLFLPHGPAQGGGVTLVTVHGAHGRASHMDDASANRRSSRRALAGAGIEPFS